MSNVSQAMDKPAGFTAWMARHADAVMMAAIGLALASKLGLAFRINLHWDEFHFLALVHEYLRGEMTAGLQTFHVHLFSWLAALGGEADQIIVGRLVMAMLSAGTALAIYGIARRFASHSASLYAVLGYVGLSVVVEHGASFRTDPLATFLAMMALCLMTRRPGGMVAAALAGAALALAALVTIKTVFFLPVIAALIWALVPGLRAQARMALISGSAFLAVGGVLYLLHVASLAPAEQAVAGKLQAVASKMLFEDGFFVRWQDFLLVVGYSPLYWIMAAEGAFFAWRAARGGGDRVKWLPLLLALPVLSPLIYRNAFFYFFPMIMAPAAILLALFYERHRQRAEVAGPRGAVLIAVLILTQCGFLALHVAHNLPDRIAPQRAVLAGVHQVFPAPVSYIGSYGVVAPYSRLGFFMSSWGVDQYRQAGAAIFPDLVAQHQPPLLLADSPSLYGALLPGISVKEKRALLPVDTQFLKENYVQHWGMIFVAGKQLALTAGAPLTFDIAVAGDYRVESSAPVSLDGRMVQPGEVVSLGIGGHRIEAAGTADVILRWAQALPPPDAAPVGLLTFFAAD